MTTNHPRTALVEPMAKPRSANETLKTVRARHAGLKALPTDAGRPDKVGHLQASRQKFDDALRSMERFIMNLDPSRVHVLRDWLRAADADGPPGRIPAPSLAGLQLVGQTGEHIKAVLAARSVWRKARHLPPSAREGLVPPAGVR